MPEYPLDKGCKKARDAGYRGQCINCPLPECLEVTVRQGRAGIKRSDPLRDRQILRHRANRFTYKEIADRVGTTAFVVRYVVRREKDERVSD
jgi:hypothetical protein